MLMARRERNEILFSAGFLLPLALYAGAGAALIFGGHWLMQPTVIENSRLVANGALTSGAYHRTPSPPPAFSSQIHSGL